ncbi:MAG TPA: glycosyltransferase family 4 protein [Thermomicrobiales bacterium]|jgi:glycosyltransferase involved in cell wall biosynthesis
MPDALTILLATDVFPPRCGGSGWSTYHLARALRARGHRPIIARPREGLRGSVLTEYDGLPVHELGFSSRGGSLPFVRGLNRQERFWPRFGQFLAELARREEVDLIHGQHLISIPAAVRAGKVTSLPTVATVRDYWPTCPIGTRLPHCPELPRCSTACQICCLSRGSAPLRPIVRAALPYVTANLRRRQRALLAADCTLAVSNYVARVLREGIPGLEPRVIPNFISIESGEPREGTGNASLALSASPTHDSRLTTHDSPRPTVLYVGKLEAHKGADLLPAALAAVPQARLLVAGAGPLAAQITRECAERGVRLDLLGERPNDEVLALMRAADALLFPARWEEPLTRTLLEAGSVGLPAVALAVGGNPDIVLNGVTGLLAAEPAGLGPALASLLADQARRARMADAARAHIAANFAEMVVVPRVEALYQELVISRRTRVR